jgi:hypothetical protein
MKINIRKTTAIACFALLWLCSCGKDEKPVRDAFEIESGPEKVGWSHLWVIRHKETGERFVLTGRSHLVPLKSREP